MECFTTFTYCYFGAITKACDDFLIQRLSIEGVINYEDKNGNY